MRDPYDVLISFRDDRATQEALRREADRERMTLSTYVRRVVGNRARVAQAVAPDRDENGRA
jgi:hypothetical protein